MIKIRYIILFCLSFALSVYSFDCTIWLYNSKPGEIYDDLKGVSISYNSLNELDSSIVKAPFVDENTRLNFFNYFSAEGKACNKCVLSGFSHGTPSTIVDKIPLTPNKLFSFPRTCLSKFELFCPGEKQEEGSEAEEPVEEEASQAEETMMDEKEEKDPVEEKVKPKEENEEEQTEYEEQDIPLY